MRTLVVYESMYGNTHTIADSIGVGLRSEGEVTVLPVHEATAELVAWADLVIVGGPTHVHGMTRPTSRHGAAESAAKPGSTVTLEPDAQGIGVRDWLAALAHVTGTPAAAFDTRLSGPALFTGRASSGIATELRHHGFVLVVEPESFFVDRENRLVADEDQRATRWGERVAAGLKVPA